MYSKFREVAFPAPGFWIAAAGPRPGNHATTRHGPHFERWVTLSTLFPPWARFPKSERMGGLAVGARRHWCAEDERTPRPFQEPPSESELANMSIARIRFFAGAGLEVDI